MNLIHINLGKVARRVKVIATADFCCKGQSVTLNFLVTVLFVREVLRSRPDGYETICNDHGYRPRQDGGRGPHHEFLVPELANIEALEEQVTRGQFSMTVQASWKDEPVGPPGGHRGLAKLGQELEMEVKARLRSPGAVSAWR